MKPAAAALALFLVSASAIADINGAWTAILETEEEIHLQLTLRPQNIFGDSSRIADFQGLTLGTVRSNQQTAVSFRLAREAGTFTFDGTFRDGLGGGQFRFSPSSPYASAVRALGLDLELRGEQTEADLLLAAALADLSTAYIRSMQKVFPDLTFREARRARGAGVSAEYVQTLRSEGVAIQSLREATRLAGVGVTVQFVRELAAAGYRNISVRDLTRLAAHGIDRDYINEMSKHKRSGDRQ